MYNFFHRIDLATEHRHILGHDDKVLQLIEATHDSALADDNQLRTALKNVGSKVTSILAYLSTFNLTLATNKQNYYFRI